MLKDRVGGKAEGKLVRDIESTVFPLLERTFLYHEESFALTNVKLQLELCKIVISSTLYRNYNIL